jgi:hypothetical protein
VSPLHTTASPIGDSAGPAGLRGPIRTLLLTSLALGAATALLGGSSARLALVLAICSLGAAALLGLRFRWAAAAPDRTPPVDADRDGTLDARLRRLYDEHVEQVNLALDEGREDLAQELADDYMDQALALITTDAEVRS